MQRRKFSLNDKEVAAFRQREAETRHVYELKDLQAVRLYGSGVEMTDIVETVGQAERSIWRWVRAYQRESLAGLQAGWDGQNANKLSATQRAEIKHKVETYRPDQILARDRRVSQGEFWTVSDIQWAVKTWSGLCV
jgi:transposase